MSKGLSPSTGGNVASPPFASKLTAGEYSAGISTLGAGLPKSSSMNTTYIYENE